MTDVITSKPFETEKLFIIGPMIVCDRQGNQISKYILPKDKYDIPGPMVYEDELTEQQKWELECQCNDAWARNTIIIEPHQIASMTRTFLNELFNK